MNDYIICYNSAISLRRGVHALYTFTVFTNFVNITFWYTACIPLFWNRFIPVSWIRETKLPLPKVIPRRFILRCAHTNTHTYLLKSMRIFNFLEKKNKVVQSVINDIYLASCYYGKHFEWITTVWKWKFMIFESNSEKMYIYRAIYFHRI